VRFNNLLFAPANQKMPSSDQKNQQKDLSSFTMILNNVTKRIEVRDNKEKAEKNKDSGTSLATLNSKLRVITMQNAEKQEINQKIDTLNNSQEDQEIASEENSQGASIILTLLLSLLQNIPNQQGRLSEETLKSIAQVNSTSIKDIIKVLNLSAIDSLDAQNQDKVLTELINFGTEENRKDMNSDLAKLLTEIIFQNGDTKTLVFEKSSNFESKTDTKNSLFDVLKKILQKDDLKSDNPNETLTIDIASGYLKNFIQFLLKNAKQMVSTSKSAVNLGEAFSDGYGLLKNIVLKGVNDESLQKKVSSISADSNLRIEGSFDLPVGNKTENTDSNEDLKQIFNRASLQFDNSSNLTKIDFKTNEYDVQALKLSVIDQIAEKISLIHKQNLTTLTVAIKPEWLGNVIIELKRDLSGNITGNIVVSSPHVKEIVESSLGNLLTILKDQGINISQLNVSLGNSSGNQQFQNQQRFSQKQYSFVHTDDAIDTLESLIYEISENVLNLRA